MALICASWCSQVLCCIILYVLTSTSSSKVATDGNCVCSVTIFVLDGCSCSPVFLKCLHSNLGLLLPRFNIFMYRLRWVALLSLNLCLFHHAGNERTSHCKKIWHIIRFFFTEDNAASFHNHPMFFTVCYVVNRSGLKSLCFTNAYHRSTSLLVQPINQSYCLDCQHCCSRTNKRYWSKSTSYLTIVSQRIQCRHFWKNSPDVFMQGFPDFVSAKSLWPKICILSTSDVNISISEQHIPMFLWCWLNVTWHAGKQIK